MKGIDIRRAVLEAPAEAMGQFIARWMMLPVGLRIAKASEPTPLALFTFDLGYPLILAAGLWVTMDHNRSIYSVITAAKVSGLALDPWLCCSH